MISVSRQFLKNIVTTWAVLVVSVVIAFFFTPYLISMLGKERYGLWSLILSITVYMAMADAGMKQSVVRYVSKYLAKEDWKQLNEVISSSARIYFFVSMVILTGTLLVTFVFLQYFKIEPGFFHIAQQLMVILGLNEAIRYIYLPFTSVGAYHRFDISSYFQIGIRIFQTLGMIILLELGLGLVPMALLVLGINIITRIWLSSIRAKLYPQVRFSMKAITSDKTKELLSYSLFSFLIVATWIIIYHTDNIVIGAFLSMEAVAVYSVAAMIVTQLRSAIQTIAVPLVPAISHFEAGQDFARIMSIYRRATKYLYYISVYIAICTLIFGGPFILLWVKKDFSGSIVILKILIVAAAIYFPQTLANSVLLGVSKHKIAFYILLGEAVSKIVLSVILVKNMGLIGVAWGAVIPQFIIYIFIYPVVFYRAMSSDVKVFYTTAAKSMLYSIIFVLPPAYLLNMFLTPDRWLTLFTDCIVVSLIMVFGLFKFILEPDDRGRIFDKIKEQMGRFKKRSPRSGDHNNIQDSEGKK